MIRGAIELVDSDRVSGWIYSASDSLRDKTVMAFVGNRCAGTGKVEEFRKDLLEAKLGDGYCGFHFPVRLLPEENPASVVVRLMNSDAVLLQSASRVVGAQSEQTVAETPPDLGAVPPGSVTWMQDHGWLEQHEHDFLKAIHTVGAYERGLRAPRRAGDDRLPAASPEAVVRGMLGIYMLTHIEVVRAHGASFPNLLVEKGAWRRSQVSVVGLWSEEHTWITVAERSHIGPRDGRAKLLDEPPPAGIDYQFGPDRILFLHRDCSFAAYKSASSAGIVLFTALPKLTAFRASPRLKEVAQAEHKAA
jgi:hypothetical protein